MLTLEQDYQFENMLAMQSEIFQSAAKAIEARKHNKAALKAQATAKIIKVENYVLLKASESLSMTAKWDFGYIVTKVNGVTVNNLHPESGSTQST